MISFSGASLAAGVVTGMGWQLPALLEESGLAHFGLSTQVQCFKIQRVLMCPWCVQVQVRELTRGWRVMISSHDTSSSGAHVLVYWES